MTITFQFGFCLVDTVLQVHFPVKLVVGIVQHLGIVAGQQRKKDPYNGKLFQNTGLISDTKVKHAMTDNMTRVISVIKFLNSE